MVPGVWVVTQTHICTHMTRVWDGHTNILMCIHAHRDWVVTYMCTWGLGGHMDRHVHACSWGLGGHTGMCVHMYTGFGWSRVHMYMEFGWSHG